MILGPTASGKTRLAARLCAHLGTELISADSRQVYRGMNIGTGKDYEEYLVNGRQVKHHLVDLVDAGEKYHIHQYKHDFFRVFNRLRHEGLVPVLCGGTGLYINAVISHFAFTSIPNNATLRERLAHHTREELLEVFRAMPRTLFTDKADTSTAKRLLRAIEISHYLLDHDFEPEQAPVVRPLIFGIDPGVELRNQRIEQRLKQRLKNGLIDEVKTLLKAGVSEEQLIYYGLEYKFVTRYLKDEMSYEGLEELLGIAIRQFAKRQMTYFRKMEKDGHVIHWIDGRLGTEEQLALLLGRL